MTTPVACQPALCPAPDDRGLGGLLALVRGREVAFPLTEVRVRTSIVGSVARTVVEQRFANPHKQPMEAVHLFPLPPNGALTEVELRCGELTVRADCREREDAERTFAEARRSGHRAALVTRERADVHTLRVTNLPPGEEVVVRMVVVEALQAEDGAFRMRFPTTIAPRYMPGNASGHDGPGTEADTDRVPDASRISPPLRLSGGTRLDLEVSFVNPPSRLQSSLHALRVDLDGGVKVAPSGNAVCDRDFVLSFGYAGAEGGAAAWTDGETTLLIVEPPMMAAKTLPRDAVFVVDISGSMGGEKMDAAKRALRTALRGLVPGDRFLLVAFDDRVERHAPAFVAFDDRSLRAGEAWVDRLQARGGTEMLPPIQVALEGDRPEGRLRTVLFVTDGQAGNDAEVTAAVANRAKGARFFTLGIDTAVNGALMEQLARVGGGACSLCTPSDDIEAVVARIEARFGSPVADGLRAEGEEARPEPRTLFAGMPATILLRGAPGAVVAKALGAGGLVTWSVTPQRTATPLGALWGRERVAWLEDRLTLRPFEEEALRPEIVRVALQFSLASRFTAFVAVERTRKVDGTLKEVVQPVSLPAGWDRAVFLGASAGAAAAPPFAHAVSQHMMVAEGDADADFSPLCCESALPSPPRSSLQRVSASRYTPSAPPASAPPPPPPSPGAAPPRGRAADLSKKEKAEPDIAALLAQSQDADGSWGHDPLRTAAALLALVRLGHTRTAGLRKRAVQKAAAWLANHAGVPAVAAVLAALVAVEGGATPSDEPAFAPLQQAGREGAMLATIRAD
ncbi:hypothetical protein LBMAG42_27560 [Deltaproteobacteria bacterium]|nr:hypothetical protein LBMAG42_27560 [Deltaproteobacteria bacterium]